MRIERVQVEEQLREAEDEVTQMIRDIEEAKKEAVKAREEMDRVVRQHDQAIHKVTA